MEAKVAYETLSDAKQRAEYDRRLRMVRVCTLPVHGCITRTMRLAVCVWGGGRDGEAAPG